MAREPAPTTKLNSALLRIIELESKLKDSESAPARIAELEKKLKDSESAKDTWYRQHQESLQMLEQVQQVLDAVPNSVDRESKGGHSWNTVVRSPVTRLAAWLAIRP